MDIAVIGVNFREASVAVRERFAVLCLELFLKRFSSTPHVFLTTCNRVEVYFFSYHKEWIQEMFLYEFREILEIIYMFSDNDCFYHLAKVAAGLDSSIIGESEIQRQVKEAYESAAKKQHLSSALHFLFQKSLRIGKTIRSKAFYHQLHGMGEVVSQFLSTHIEDVKELPILFIGYSEINRQIIDYFLKLGWKSLSLCTRNPNSVIFPKLNVFDHEKLDSWIEYKVVIVGVKEPNYLINLQIQPIQTEYLIDLGVPRNVNPSLEPFIKKRLLNIDDLITFQKTEFRSFLDMKPLEKMVRAKAEQYCSAYFKKTQMKFSCSAIRG
jgi:glutamyl-tRNA reductase